MKKLIRILQLAGYGTFGLGVGSFILYPEISYKSTAIKLLISCILFITCDILNDIKRFYEYQS